ncbi:MAG: helix-turn-helix domain-containing protein, partial [Prevotellaceae bacterium]|nr:helix-turn-helix domain-containing protein [Prevotellaceae bacterium]
GNYYFGSYEGVTIFNPLNIQPQKPAGRLYFQDFFLFNQIVKPDIDGAKRTLPLHDALDNISEITLKYYQHSFSINFSAIDYANTQNRHFAWMLENLDKEWNSPSAETTANYTNIGTGRYVFRLRYLGDNNAVLDERALTITVAPPFWNTAWARILEIILTIALLTWVYLYTRRRIRKRQTQERIEIFLRMQTTSEFTRKATAIVEQNLTNTAFSVSDFSKEMGLSRSMLYSKFNSLTGYSPNDFIKEVRMKKAIDYFREKKHTINEIAYMVGFDEPAYFSTCFKKIYGKTPSQFILEMKSEYK